jgi:hypothetical protein
MDTFIILRQVSVITKMVPSPDWFIGLDSLQLCRGGGFIESFTTEAVPMDAGTDNGFTFTSPNWETEPRGAVFNITSSFPSHPAGSLHYPGLAALPRLAQYSFTKVHPSHPVRPGMCSAEGVRAGEGPWRGQVPV